MTADSLLQTPSITEAPQVGIESIAVVVRSLRLRQPFSTSFGTYQELKRPFVVVHTEDGLRGLGEIPTLADPAYKPEADTPSVLTSLREWLIPTVFHRQDSVGPIATVDALRASYAWVKGAVFAKSGLEAALWDIVAQRQGQPLWQLWGGQQHRFPVGTSIGGQTTDQILDRASAAVARGIRRLKVKIWPGFDEAPVAALRSRFPDILLQVDANSAYDRTNWRALCALDGYGLLLIEQPLFDDDLIVHAQISRDLRTPICLDESIHSRRDVEAAIDLWRAADRLDRLIVNVKAPRVGGFAEAIAIASICAESGVSAWIGGMLDSAWGKAMNLQLNTLTAFDLPGDHASPGGPYFVEDVAPTPALDDGMAVLGDQPSAGVQIDWEAMERLGTVVIEARRPAGR